MPLYLACVGAALGLEWLLASRESRWPGLALPAVNLLLSILAAVGLASYMRIGDDWIAGSVAALLLSANIPTALLLLLYAACRRRRRRRRELDIMDIEDLK